MDIIAIAYHTLIDPVLYNYNYQVLGPELLIYNNITNKLSHILG